MPLRRSTYLFCLLVIGAATANAGEQKYGALSASVQSHLSRAVNHRTSETSLLEAATTKAWLEEMSRRLARRIPDQQSRTELLRTVYYEASRAGLDPELVMALIEVESGFRKYAISTASARGFMQVMPFWVGLVGTPRHNLFQTRTNLRYGCTILRHYLDIEKGDLFRALGRYNGSLGKAEYPNLVLAAWQNRWTMRNDAIPSASRQVSASAGERPG